MKNKIGTQDPSGYKFENNFIQPYKHIIDEVDEKTKGTILSLINYLNNNKDLNIEKIKEKYSDLDEDKINEIVKIYEDIEYNEDAFFPGLIVCIVTAAISFLCYQNWGIISSAAISTANWITGTALPTISAFFMTPVGLYVGIGIVIVTIVAISLGIYFSYPATSDDIKIGTKEKQMAPIIDDNESVPANHVKNGAPKQPSINTEESDNNSGKVGNQPK